MKLGDNIQFFRKKESLSQEELAEKCKVSRQAVTKWEAGESTPSIAIVNLPPRSMMGIDSCGMLLSAIHNVNGEEKLNLVMLDDSIPAGAKLY